MLHTLRRWNWAWAWRGLWALLLIAVAGLAIPAARPDTTNESFRTLGIARDHLFDFAEWEIDALTDKAGTALLAPHRYMTDDQQVEFVRDYLEMVGQIREIEREVEAIYIDPAISDPNAASAGLRSRRDALRSEQQSQQAIAEAIVQGQTGDMLVEYGFGTGDVLLPPVQVRFTQLPTLLIISPRDRIERIGAYPLEHGLTVDQRSYLEEQVDEQLGVSSIIEPLGGLAVYPAMMIETGNLPFTYEVAAHEWMHHYLAFYPLGFNYGATPALYTLNETTASIIGNEISWAVLNRYYPEYAGPPPDYTPKDQPDAGEIIETEPDDTQPREEPAFDFRATMRETRIQVDDLLAVGRIEEAEAYMEAQRLIFVENGYSLRKLNQAYFAFHGSYADEPGSSGSDPIGPMVRELRYYSESLHDFTLRIRGVTTTDDLEAALSDARRDAESRIP